MGSELLLCYVLQVAMPQWTSSTWTGGQACKYIYMEAKHILMGWTLIL
jgi:hypothetical protein